MDLLQDFLLKLNASDISFKCDVFGNGDYKHIVALRNISGVHVYGYEADWKSKVDDDYIFLMFSDYEGCPLSLLEFHKFVGKKAMVRRSNGLKQYVSENCLFEGSNDAVKMIIDNVNIKNIKIENHDFLSTI